MTAFALIIVYRALILRRALVDRPYRARAAWTAVGGLTVVSFAAATYIDSIFGETPTTDLGVLVEAVAWGFTFLGLFGWIANNINVAIAADFFNRDALLWKKGGGISALVALFTGYALASVPSWWWPEGSQAVADLSSWGIELLFAAAAIYATFVMALTYVRIKDTRIKNYTMWVVLSVLAVFLMVIFPSSIILIPVAIWVYCMYRSVGALAIRTHSLE